MLNKIHSCSNNHLIFEFLFCSILNSTYFQPTEFLLSILDSFDGSLLYTQCLLHLQNITTLKCNLLASGALTLHSGLINPILGMENFHLVNYFNYLSVQLALQSFEHEITLRDFEIKFINGFYQS